MSLHAIVFLLPILRPCSNMCRMLLRQPIYFLIKRLERRPTRLNLCDFVRIGSSSLKDGYPLLQVKHRLADQAELLPYQVEMLAEQIVRFLVFSINLDLQIMDAL